MVAVLAVGFVANLLIRPVVPTVAPEAVDSAGVAGKGSARVLLSWGLVSLLLVYGVYETLTTASKLFG